jgi:hypothetical protein
MAKKAATKTRTSPGKLRGATTVHRFSHPFLGSQVSAAVPNVGTNVTDFVKDNLAKIPPATGDSVMLLENIIGAQETALIKASKSILFHAVGDTGHEQGEAQQAVSDAMASDYNFSKPEKSPAAFLHLGDVIYYNNTDEGYHAQFYEPYKKYPGKIVAIPGNHDGEIYSFKGSTGQKKTLEAFMSNFCLKKPSVPPAAGTIYRQMVNQPGVYWVLKAPFVNIVGLYSNIAEGPGYISGTKTGNVQKKWLDKTLKDLKKERDNGTKKALIIAVHHPPLSRGGHAGSNDMLSDIDDSCAKAGIWPDAVLAAHAHNYQRFTRNKNNRQVPFIVAGTGGRGITNISSANGATTGDHSYDVSLKDYGYLMVEVSEKTLLITFIRVDHNDGTKRPFDKVKLDLVSGKIIQ